MEGPVGTDGFLAAPKDRGIAGLDAEGRGVDRDIRPALVDHEDDADRHADLGHVEPVGPPAGGDHLADRVGQRRNLFKPGGDRADPLLVQRQPVDRRRVQAEAGTGLDVEGVGRHDLGRAIAEGPGGPAEPVILGRAPDDGQPSRPKPVVSDDTLLAAIRADLARSPWHGEGHRKVWARLRVMDGIRVARKRVLRLMRENTLLSPHRARTRDDTPHDRHIITDAPNIMWATDATQIITVQDGRVWLFGVVEHWNAEALGWHVAKRGDRYAAVQAVGMAVRNAFGQVSPSAARGVALRHDHGSAFLAEHFHNQIRFWGMTPSYAFVGEPETNGVVERFFRTLKEQIVHGRIYQTTDEVRDAVRDFIARYNAEWLIEKNGLRSPIDARTAWHQAVMKAAA